MESTEARIKRELEEALALVTQLPKTRDTAMVATKLDEALLWLRRHTDALAVTEKCSVCGLARDNHTGVRHPFNGAL